MSELSIEEILVILKNELEPIQEKLNNSFDIPEHPVLLILGSPRSGTTLLLQFLANSGIFSYPSNLLARFAYAPYIGSLVQKLIFDDKIGMIDKNLENYSSELGKSEGSLGVNEFYHFWRRFIPLYFPQKIDINQFNKINFNQIFREIASIESVFNKPFVCKGMMLQYNLTDLGNHSSNFNFIQIKRNPVFVMQSIFQARNKYFGNVNEWWSVKTKEYEYLKKMDVYHQIAGQVFFSEKEVEQGLTKISSNNQATVFYEDFCKNPKNVLNEIIEKFGLDGDNIKRNIPESFQVSDKIKIEIKHFDALKDAYEDFETSKIVIESIAR